MHWFQAASELLAHEDACVRVVVAQVKGSAPREVGASMLVGRASARGTIGGGALEFEALRDTRDMLQDGSRAVRFKVVPLGPNLGQCCGGQVTLCFQLLRASDLETMAGGADPAGRQVLLTRDDTVERTCSVVPMEDLQELGISPLAARRLRAGGAGELLKAGSGRLFCEPLRADRQQVFLFGAGHVGKEIVHVLGRHDLEIYWLDARAGEFPASVPENTHRLNVPKPVDHVAIAPEGADFLVMTHDHALDLALCDAILRKGDFRFLGLIGSDTKHTRFKRRLQEAGHDPAEIARMTCPIGLSGLRSKRPEVIAVSLAAQLLSLPGAGNEQGTAGGA